MNSPCINFGFLAAGVTKAACGMEELCDIAVLVALLPEMAGEEGETEAGREEALAMGDGVPLVA